MSGQIRAVAVGQLDVFEMIPDAFIGVEIGCVAGQSFQPDTAIGLAQPVFDDSAAVDWRTVPDHQQSIVDLPQQVFQEADRERAVDRRLVNREGAATVARDAADDRRMVACLPFSEHGCLANRTPRRVDRRQRVESRFIDQHDRSPLTSRFFSDGARSFAANSRWPLRHVAEHVAAAADDSSRTCAAGFPHAAASESHQTLAATRGRVHKSPRKPCASAPWASSWGIFFCCSAVNRGGRPERFHASGL